MVDLHTHSNASDGDLSPDLLVRHAVQQGLQAIALTDHDTINGLEIARNEAARSGIRFIPGIEINIDWKGDKTPAGISGTGPGGEFHLLGLGIRSPSSGFISAINELFRRREARNFGILQKMAEMGIEAQWEDVKRLSGGHSVGRLHFARLLINMRIVKNYEQAFAQFLGAGKPLFVPKENLAFDEAVALIRESGGIPVLAHPMSLFVAWGRLPELVKTLKERGLMGIEAWHPTAKAQSCRRLTELGKSLGLYITEGSDFHGSIRPERALGYSHRGRKIDNQVLEAIPELRAE
jgi:predicted metal-dependent phosphoesterase TrpH